MPLDLLLLPLYRIAGQEKESLPGVAIFEPPRRAARGRQEDRLLFYLAPLGNHPVPLAELQRLLQEAAADYYATAGSVTAALRAAAIRLNRALLERNLALRSQRRYTLGLLFIFTLRPEQLIFAQSGPTQLFLWQADGLHPLHDPARAGQGLGYSQNLTLRYGQIPLQAGQRLLICGKLPPAWEDLPTAVLPLPLLYRHLMLRDRQAEIHGLLMGIEAGRGAVTWLPLPDLSAPVAPPAADQSRPAAPQPLSRPPLPEATSPAPATPYPAHYIGAGQAPTSAANPPSPTETVGSAAPTVTSSDTAEAKAPPAASGAPATPEAAENATSAAKPPTAATAASAYALPPASTAAPPPPVSTETPGSNAPEAVIAQEGEKASGQPRRPPSSETFRPFARALLNLLRKWQQLRQRWLDGLRRFLPRLLPGEESSLPLTTQWLLLLLAIAIPLVTVTAATVVYFRYGRNVEYQTYLAQAQTLRDQALTAQDPLAQRDAWQGVLFYLSKAESYRSSEETRALRSQASQALDQLFGIVRLDFRPTFSTALPLTISRMASSQNDLYLLDAQRGQVARAVTSGRGLRLDEGFQCGPGKYGELNVGALVDLIPLPEFNLYDAAILSVDANGTLLYCTPDRPPQAVALPRPNANWRRVTAFALDGETLYVLDAAARAIWEYPGYQSKFEAPPRFVFQEQVPPIQDGIDLAVHQDTLYVLHASGKLTVCQYSRLEGVPTRCTSPAPLIDPYPAHQGQGEFQSPHFTQLSMLSMPGTPLVFLDEANGALYRFSSRSLELQTIWKPATHTPLPPLPWSAFTISPENVLYLALGDRLYFAPLP